MKTSRITDFVSLLRMYLHHYPIHRAARYAWVVATSNGRIDMTETARLLGDKLQ